MGRPFDKHIDNRELNVLVPSPSETGQESFGLSQDAVREAERHVRSCVRCNSKVSKYRQLVNPASRAAVSKAAPPGITCPKDADVDWYEVAAGLWPELKAKQLIMHAALCDHCGPLLRAAVFLDDEPTAQEEKLLAQLKSPARPNPIVRRVRSLSAVWPLMRWLVPAVALLLIVGILARRPPSSPTQLSGPKLAEFAVTAYKQHAKGSLALDVRSDSEQSLNEWFKSKSPFSLALETSAVVPGKERPYRLEGTRLLQIGSKTVAYIAYTMQTGPVGLMVMPNSVAVASGGIEVNFKKLRFHYAMVEGYKVVTWSTHGLTYALVSQEGNRTQQSCMVCHSAMRDRDLTHTPTPLDAGKTIATLFSD